MTNWKKTLNIKGILHDQDRTTQEKAQAVLAVLEPEAMKDEPYWLEDMRLCASDPEVDDEEVNGVLSEIYNWADRNKIWLGL